jgi:hypothetical protein
MKSSPIQSNIVKVIDTSLPHIPTTHSIKLLEQLYNELQTFSTYLLFKCYDYLLFPLTQTMMLFELQIQGMEMYTLTLKCLQYIINACTQEMVKKDWNLYYF